MTISDCINLIAAILVGGGTITLAVMTWKAIRQTRAVQKSERKERLLNEIIEWAEGIHKRLPFEKSQLDKEGVNDLDSLHLHMVAELGDMAMRFHDLRVKALYIGQIASSFGQSLNVVIEEVKNDLEDYMKLYGKCQAAVPAPGKPADYKKYSVAFGNIGRQEVKLDESADKVVIEATKIKIAQIG